MAKNKRPNPEQNPEKQPSHSSKPIKEQPLVERELEGNSISNFMGQFKLNAILIMVFSCLLYVNTIPHKYAVDDAIVITRNQFTAKGFNGMKGIWGEDTFVGFFGDSKNLVMGGRYRPFSVATFALENQLFGSVIKNTGNQDMVAMVKDQPTVIKPGQPILDKDGDVNYEGNPHISHLINLLLYGLLNVLLYWMFVEMFNPRWNPNAFKANFIAFVAAILFAGHPIHTEAVANIKGRDEILVLMGSIMAVYWTLKAYNQRERAEGEPDRSMRYMIYAVLGFLMGIFSKENAITFVAIIPVALYLFTNAKPMDIGLRTLPFVAVCLLFWFGIRSLIFLDMNTYDIAQEYMNDPFMKVVKSSDGVATYADMTGSERYGLIVYSWLVYIKLLIFPHPLTNDYYPLQLTYHPDGEIIPDFSHPLTILSALLHLGLGALFVWGMLRRHAIAFCVIFYAATFSVVSNLFFAIGTVMAERFMFLPSVGFSLACAMGLWALGERLQKGAVIERLQQIKLPMAIFALVIGLYSVKTFVRNKAWVNDQILFITDIEVSNNSAKLNNAVSGVYQEYLVEELKQPMHPASLKKREDYIKKALYHAKRAIDMHPMYNQAWLLLGNAHVYQGDHFVNIANGDTTKLDSAAVHYLNSISDFRFVITLRYDHPDAIKNMWVSYNKMASMLETKAAIVFQQTGNAVRTTQIYNTAVAYYDQLIDYCLNQYPKISNNFKHPDIPSVLGFAYRERGQILGKRLMQLDFSIQSLEVAAQYMPNDPNIYRMLGVANGIKGAHVKAVEFFEKALQIGGMNIAILYNLEIAYAALQAQAAEQKLDPVTIAGYDMKRKEYHDKWFALNPNYDPSKEQ